MIKSFEYDDKWFVKHKTQKIKRACLKNSTKKGGWGCGSKRKN